MTSAELIPATIIVHYLIAGLCFLVMSANARASESGLTIGKLIFGFFVSLLPVLNGFILLFQLMFYFARPNLMGKILSKRIL